VVILPKDSSGHPLEISGYNRQFYILSAVITAKMEEQIKTALEKQNPWWFNKNFDTGIPRLSYYPELQRYLKTPETIVILGARRTGKSTLLYQLIQSLSVPPEAILFINLDEPIFISKSEDPSFLSNLVEEYTIQHKDIQKFYVFIDEVQNYTYWVPTLKTLDTAKHLKFILTGSTSTLLETAASTRLSGRYFSTTVYPLSFSEYLAFNNIEKPNTLEKRSHLQRYLQYGAFPRVVLEKDVHLKRDLLKNYFQTIYLKDIIYPHKVRNNKDVFDLLYFAISNVGKLFSYTNLAKTLEIDKEAVKEYLTYAEQAYLIFSINKYDHSVKKQLANSKKIYCLDTGLVNSISFRFSENKGHLLENLIFVTLKPKYQEIFYHKELNECDFLIKEGLKITQAIQVTITLQEDKVRQREIKGLLEAMNTHKLKEGIIVTEAEEEIIKVENKVIRVIPAYKWMHMERK
jgi:uncharacterized protein